MFLEVLSPRQQHSKPHASHGRSRRRPAGPHLPGKARRSIAGTSSRIRGGEQPPSLAGTSRLRGGADRGGDGGRAGPGWHGKAGLAKAPMLTLYAAGPPAPAARYEAGGGEGPGAGASVGRAGRCTCHSLGCPVVQRSGAGSVCRTRAPGVLQPPPAPPRFVRSRSRCHPQPRGHRWPGDAAAARCRGPQESPGVRSGSGASPLVAVGAAGAGRPLPGQDSCSLAARCPWAVPAGNRRRDFRCGE